MKKGISSLQKFAEILLVLIILLSLIAFISPNYREVWVNGIKKIFGEQTEEEILHEKNLVAEGEFILLENNLKRCESSSSRSCGCSFNIKNLNENNLILSTESDIRLINKGKIQRDEILKDLSKGVLNKKIDIKNTNCFFDGELNRIETAKIFFDKTIPYIYEKRGWIFVKDEIPLNLNYQLYKDAQGNICWLSGKIQNIKPCQ